jgi:hypothetical protein
MEEESLRLANHSALNFDQRVEGWIRIESLIDQQ